MKFKEISIQQEILNRVVSRHPFVFPKGETTKGKVSINLYQGVNPSQGWESMYDVIYGNVTEIVTGSNHVIATTKTKNGIYSVDLYV